MSDVLKYFFESYFHQDWRDEYSNSFEALEDFLGSETAETRKCLVSELIDLRAQQDIVSFDFRRFGANFRPETEGLSVTEWLDKAVNFLQDKSISPFK